MRDYGRIAGIGLLSLLVLLQVDQSEFARAQSLDSLRAAGEQLVQRLDDNTYTLGNLRVNKQTREIEIPGWINMNQGALEYLAVTPTGKTHESLLALDVQPLHLQIALLLLGLDCGQNLEVQGDSALPAGDEVSIDISWVSKSGKTVKRAATELVRDVKRQASMKKTAWVFTGSRIHEGYFLADEDGSIIAVYSDPIAILNNPLKGRGDDTSYEVNTKAVPATGTAITLRIKAGKD